MLGDPEKRQIYDRYGHAGLSPAAMPHFNNAPVDLRSVRRHARRHVRRPAAPRAAAGQRFAVRAADRSAEAARGCKKTLTIPRQENCGDCGGSGCRRGTRPATCRQCRGQGVVLLSQGFFRIQQTCRGCGGRGTIITDPCAAVTATAGYRCERHSSWTCGPGPFMACSSSCREKARRANTERRGAT